MILGDSIRAAWLPWSCALILGGLCDTLAAAEPPPLDKPTQAFLKQHCYECHGPDAQEAGLALHQLSGDLSSRASVQKWTLLYDRMAAGEMPPKDSPRPKPAELKAVLDGISPRLTAADRAQREVVQRRLNREEYEYTLRDLLGIELDVKTLLPEDQQAGGFDNNGEALAISTDQMARYLEAAELALNAALVRGPQPTQVTLVASALDEVKQYLDKSFALIDGRIVTYTSDATQYSKISTRAKRTPLPGKYRFKFQAAAHRSQDPVVFSVVASDFASVGAIFKNLGYFEVGAEPKTFEIVTTLPKGFAIQFFALGLPGWLKDPITGNHPGVGFGEVEITGPLYESWPPPSHTRLVGETDLAKGTAADAERILRQFLPRAFRRPAAEDEVARYLQLFAGRIKAGRSFEQSLRTTLAAVLCSPNFLYLREDVRPGTTRISEYELASRLSYTFWSSPPDDELLKLAGENKLSQPAVLRAQVDRLLNDPKGERFVKNFTGQWLRLRDIDETTPDKKLYADFDELLKISMVAESEGFFRKLLVDDRGVQNFIDSDFAMLNGRLAKHYGIPGVVGYELREVKLPADSPRGGVLTQGAVLKVTANGTTTSPVTRGVWVLENILGRPTRPPPPNVAGIEPDIRGAQTIREQLALHRNVEMCNSCHQFIDPPGFALEAFDPVGKHRQAYLRFVVNPKFVNEGWGSVQAGAKVDPSGQLSTGQKFADIKELKRLLLTQKEEFARCLAEKLLTYALGRELGFSDRAAVTAAVQSSAAKQHGLRTLVHAVVASPAFVTR